jgi:trimeric autotransporter adhesin
VKKQLALVLGVLSSLAGCGGGSPALPPTPPTLVLAPASLSFGVSVVETTSSPQVDTLTNDGGSELVINSVAITGTNATDFDESSTCGSSLDAGASCTLNVTFTPTQLGPRSASIIITDDAAVSSQVLLDWYGR